MVREPEAGPGDLNGSAGPGFRGPLLDKGPKMG